MQPCAVQAVAAMQDVSHLLPTLCASVEMLLCATFVAASGDTRRYGGVL